MADSSTDIRQSSEWQQAVAYEIADHDIERQRRLIGHWEPLRIAEYVQTASHDSIRNWAFGCGDDNPLFTDPAYARRTRWGGVIAPGMMVGQINRPMQGDPVPDEIRALRKSLFKGIHVFVSGSNFRFYRPVRPGDTI
jgi:acyl dehydratase